MKKPVLGVLTLSTLLGLGVLTSCEDEFTEQDVIAQQDSLMTKIAKQENDHAIALEKLTQEQKMAYEKFQDSLARIGPIVNYTVMVTAAGEVNTNARTSGKSLASQATVTLAQGGVSQTVETDENGVANFGDLRIGEAVVTVSAPEHTTVTFSTRLGEPYSGIAEDNVETIIPIFPTTIAAGASEITGNVTAETDLTNDTPEFAEGAIVRASLSVSGVLGTYGISTGSTSKGAINTISYHDFVVTDTVDADGKYSLVVPNANGDNGDGILSALEVDFLPFESKQKLVVKQGDSLALLEKDAIFGNGTESDIEVLPSVYVEISAPSQNAGGLELGVKANATRLSTYSEIHMVSRGDNYAVGDTLFFSKGTNGEQAFFLVDEIIDQDNDGKGPIQYYSGIDDDADGDFTNALYDKAPTISHGTDTEGTGATFKLAYETTYKVFIKNEGSGYYFLPKVNASATRYVGTSLSDEIDANVNDFSSNILYGVFDDVVLIDGKVKSTSGDGDTLTSTQPLASAPVINILAPEVRKAMIDPSRISMNDGKITSIDFFGEGDSGIGYTSRPTVTIKSAIDGKATSANVVAEMDTNDGSINQLVIIDGGSEFISNINDIDKDKGDEDQNQTVSSSLNVSSIKPGAKGIENNFSYGTGKRK